MMGSIEQTSQDRSWNGIRSEMAHISTSIDSLIDPFTPVGRKVGEQCGVRLVDWFG
jgi:hypothetical protein